MKLITRVVVIAATLLLIASAFQGSAKSPAQEIVLPDITITE